MSKITCYLKHSSPTILTCLSVVGAIGTVILAGKATPKAFKQIEERKEECNVDELSPGETIRTVWGCYIPTAVTGLATVTCIIGINCMSRRNQASLASAYGLLSESYKRYRESAKTIYGLDADEKIKAEMAKKTYISADGISVCDSELIEGSEPILCYDMFSQRYFYATMPAVLNAEYHVNRNLQLRGDVSVNEFYNFLGLELLKDGDGIGWGLDWLIEDGLLWLDFENHKTVMDDGMECCVISTWCDPRDFYSLNDDNAKNTNAVMEGGKNS